MKKAFYAAAAAAATLALGGVPVEPFTAPASAQFMGENFTCETAEADLSREISNSEPLASAGLIVQLRHLMWMLQSGTRWLEGNCSSEDGYSSALSSWQRSFDATENACRGMASSPGDCTPLRYYP